ncbi:DUF397 domain-containing protein [Prauserella cavernicola]|uniref:DUF397 domain-containing protein n=1 Tax=Prauserella cavernicola TaxID=2800127 RepID=A0A934V8U4_9PSEU|nr:DUF397 domain-containing protein [Prauserella cavernicola]MBK1788650.1 DUF397 domain-containing protein [Prauserella cavernicola]
MGTKVDSAGLHWRKSSHSGGGNDCVEIAFTADGTAVRDSKNPAVGALSLPAAGWDALLSAARSGELNLR